LNPKDFIAMTNSQGPIYYDGGPLKGGVSEKVYRDPDNAFMRIIRGVGGVLKEIGGRVAEYAPEILQGVAAGLAMSPSGSVGGIRLDSLDSFDNGLSQNSDRSVKRPSIKPIPMQEIPQYKPSTLGRDALRQVESRRQTIEPSRYAPSGNPLAGLINQTASNSIHQSRQSVNPTPYTEIPTDYQQSNEAFLRALDPNFRRSAATPIQEDWTQIQRNLAHAKRPLTQTELNILRQQQEIARQQAEMQTLQEQMRQDNYRREFQ
jgi:hypothetical protein